MSNKWKVWNFDCNTDTVIKSRKRKRKSNVNIRKMQVHNVIARPQTPVSQVISSESSSPIIGNATVQNADSPILNSALTYSQSDPDTSPVMNRNIKKAIQMQKCRRALKNKVLPENNNSCMDKENRIRKVCAWIDNEENYDIEVENSQTPPTEPPVKLAKHDSWIHIDKISDSEYLNRHTVLNRSSNYVNKSGNHRLCMPDHENNIEMMNSQELSQRSSPILASGCVKPLWNCNVANTQSISSHLSSLEPLLTNKFPLSTLSNETQFKSEQSVSNNVKCCSKSLKNSFRHLYSQEERFEIELVSSQDTISVSTALESAEIQVSDVSSPKTGSSSQTSTAVSINSNYTIVPDSLEGSSYETLYNLPKKSRKYKPGTLAHQFHKLLRRQKADIGIWRHEMYLSNTSDYKMPATKDDHLITKLKILNVSNDFSCTVFECTELVSDDKCLVIADLSGLQDQQILEAKLIEIYPPYFVQYYNVNNENCVKTFLNVHKIVGINQ
ncbi:hypothetical protein CBL_07852 [Carabus blaptoides fortunei]